MAIRVNVPMAATASRTSQAFLGDASKRVLLDYVACVCPERPCWLSVGPAGSPNDPQEMVEVLTDGSPFYGAR